jgi:SAM-dependent methyltransferase
LKSPIYWHPLIYRSFIRGLYGWGFKERYEILAALIEPRSMVVEACMGDAYLYLNYLRPAGIDYVGLDINEAFVDYARRRQVRAQVHDLRQQDVPSADFVVLQGSLHQFMPDHAEILSRLQAAARKKLIVSEPVKNLVTSDKSIIAAAARAFSDTEVDSNLRFTENSFVSFCEQRRGFETMHRAGGGRDMIAVFSGFA